MEELENSYNDLCRLCASKLNIIEGISIFEGDSIKELHKKITTCLPIQVHISDKLPKMICVQCVYKLDEIYDFRQKCVHTETLLTGLIKHSGSLQQCETILIVRSGKSFHPVASHVSEMTLSPNERLTVDHDQLDLETSTHTFRSSLTPIIASPEISTLDIELSSSQNIDELPDNQVLDIRDIAATQTISLNNQSLDIREESLEHELEFQDITSGSLVSRDELKSVEINQANGMLIIKCEIASVKVEDKFSERPDINSANIASNPTQSVIAQENSGSKCALESELIAENENNTEEYQAAPVDAHKCGSESKLFGCNDCGKMCMELGELQDHFNTCPPQSQSKSNLESEIILNQCRANPSVDTRLTCNQNLLIDVEGRFVQDSPIHMNGSQFHHCTVHDDDHQYDNINEQNGYACQNRNTDNFQVCNDSDSTIKDVFNQCNSNQVVDAHKCHICSIVCLDAINLEAHSRNVHHRIESQQCKVNFQMNLKHDVEFSHYNSDEEDEPEPLKDFDDEYDEDEDDEEDDIDIHNDNEKVTTISNEQGSKKKKWEPKVCKECGKAYRTNYKLTEHMRKHTGEKPYKCSTCDKAFRSKIGLAQHEAKHTGQYDFACGICGKGFQCKSYLIVHQRVHSDLKPYPCTSCNSNFKTKQSMLDHMNRHLGVKPYLCETCGRGFITKGLCKSHQRVHSGTDNRQFPCNVCQKMFVSKSYLATHLRIHTGEKPFMCEVCGKGFLTRVDLRIHSTMHTGEKSFVCEMCGKAFARRDALRCHRRSHTGERPYRCDVCGQSFTQFSPMAIHKRLHTGERPYKCDQCSRTFVSRSTMMSHKKKHTANTFSN